MKYQITMFYSLPVEAESEEEAEEKAGEYIASEEGQGVRLSDMSFEIENQEVCGNCGRTDGVRKLGALIRCERCAEL